jgi:hypothetical protein
MRIASLKAAGREQKLEKLYQLLEEIIPDISDQYTTFKIDNELLKINTRMLHSFQVNLALKAIEFLSIKKSSFIADVGDSSGSHITYLKTIIANDQRFVPHDFKFVSINIDQVAINKIRSKGIEAILCRAEELDEKYAIKADLFMSFETLEHLSDPLSFLDNISKKSISEYFVLTVPYLSRSRVGLHHIRNKQYREVIPENTHIFELSPDDWKLIFQHSGWNVLEERIYRQYPFWSWWILMKPIWKKFDFEGFYGAILKKDRTWSNCSKT